MLMDDKHKEIFLTAKEISDFFRIPLNTVYRLSKLGKIKGIKVGKQWRYSKSDIEKILSGDINLENLNIYPEKEFKERRTYPRMNCYFQCRYRRNIPSETDFIANGYIKNISGGGVFLYDYEYNLKHINVGDPVDLLIDFVPDLRKLETVLTAKGRIIRKTQDGVGIKFREIKDEYKNMIIQYVG